MLAEHIVKHGDVTLPEPKVSKAPAAQEPIAAKESTEHIPSRKMTIKDEAKDIVGGGAAGEAALAKYTSGIPGSKGEINIYGRHADIPAQAAKAKDIQAMIDTINKLDYANKREVSNANDAIDKLNAALGETLKKSPEVALDLQRKHSDLGVDAAKDATLKTRAHVEKYILDALGGKVTMSWDKIMHAGDFTKATKAGFLHAIRVSVHALDPQGAAYHESLHGFFQLLRDQGNHDVMNVLYKAAKGAPVMNQLRKLLKNEPEALKQIGTDLEERVAYMYQFYAKGKLTLGPESGGFMQRLKDFFMSITGLWTNDKRAEHIMEYFQSGEFAQHIGDKNATARALLEPGTNKHIEAIKNALQPLKRMEEAVFGAGASRLRDTDNPALNRLADLINPKTGQITKDVGFIQASRNAHTERMNAFAKKVAGISEEDMIAAHEAIRRGEKGNTPDQKRAVIAIRDTLDEAYKYMSDAGVRVGDLGFGTDYFPRIWNAEYLSSHQNEFRAMMDKYVVSRQFVGSVDDLLNTLMSRDGAELGVVVDMPGMQHTKERKLAFISNQDAAPFMQKNLFHTMNGYLTQAARRAEWARRFNDDGSGMRNLLREAKEVHGAMQEDIDSAQSFIRGIDGTLGDYINPTMRRQFGNMIVYQNVRLLPLALFSSIVDPGGILVRGGTMGDAFKTFKRGIMEIPRGFRKNKATDEWYQLAQDIGAIDDATLSHTLGSSYTQGMVSESARKINDALFRFNMVEQFTMSTRVGATEAAVRFMAKHADGTHSKHSDRWMAELGYEPGELRVRNGRPLIHASEFVADGMSHADAVVASNKVKGALNKWVDGAILRPNSADKPIWMNDPHYALIAHLKQFTYAFQHTILERAWHEAEHGNYAPALTLAGYVPTMIAADLVKGMIQGGGSQPDWKKGWGFQQYLANGVQRAGLYGVGQYSVDFITDIQRGGVGFTSLLGPSIEQMVDGVQVLGGSKQFKPVVMHSLPANTLYSHMFDGSASVPDPNFIR